MFVFPFFTQMLTEHDAAGERAYQEWMASKGAEYERKRNLKLK